MFALESLWWLIWPTVFRGKFCQIPRRRLPNSAAHRGKFLEFRGSPRPPNLEYICADFGPVMPQSFSIIVTSNY